MTDKANEPTEPKAPASPAELEVENDDNYSRYLLHSKAEIAFVLKALAQKGAMITVYFNGGNSFLLTSLNQINSDSLIFDYGSDEEMNRRALQAEKLAFATTLDKVKIQFSLQGLRQTTYEGRKAFIGQLPETVLRLQRREYYRLTTPIANPIKVIVEAISPGGAKTPIEASMLDISGGGLGLMVPLTMEEIFRPGTTFRECRFTLPEEAPLVCSLLVRNAFPVTNKAGSQNLRIGCEYVDLPGTRLSAIQRYITRIERERKARLSGLE